MKFKRRLVENYNKNRLNESNYRGAKNVEFMGHGEWSDPELEYDGYIFNYWDVEDALWTDFLATTGYSDNQSEDPKVENEFNKYVQQNVAELLNDFISAGDFTGLSLSSNLMDFPNGDYLYVDYDRKSQCLVAGDATNNGVIPNYKVKYDFDESIDANLQNLYDEVINQSPWYLEESFNDKEDCKGGKCGKRQLNEGPGAGYNIEGTLTKPIVTNIKDVKFVGEDEYGKYYEVELDATATFSDIYASSYYYGGKVYDSNVNIIRCRLNIDEEPTKEDVIYAIDGAKINALIGSGYVHTTFDGFIECDLNKSPSSIETSYSIVDAILFEFTDDYIVQEIDDLVTGYYENEDEDDDMDESLLNEAPTYDMSPQYDARKSFYGKARVDDNGTSKTLYSYNTPVAKIENGKVTLLDLWDSSQTTLRHVKEFLKQNGFEASSLAQMRKMYECMSIKSKKKLKESVNVTNKRIKEGWYEDHLDIMERKSSGYYKCYKIVKKARTSNPIDTDALENARDYYGYDLYKMCLDDVLKEMDSLNESDEEQPYTKKQVEAELKSLTQNFTREKDTLKCGFKEEAEYGEEILSKYYASVEVDKYGSWYHIEFKGRLNKKNESFNRLRNEEGKLCADKWYADVYPDDEVGIEQLDGLFMDDILKDRKLINHCDTQVRDRVNAQLDKYIPMASMNEAFSHNIDLDRVVINVSNLLDDKALGEDWIEVFPTVDAYPIQNGEYGVKLEITGPDDVTRKANFHTNRGRVSVMFWNGSEAMCNSEEEIARFIAGEFGINLDKLNESIDNDEIIDFKRDVQLADELDDIQQLIYSLSDGVAEEVVQDAFNLACDNDISVKETAEYVIASLDAYLEDNEWLGESLNESSEKILTNKKGDYLVKASSGKGYTIFNKNDVCIGGMDSDDEEEAKSKFIAGKVNEAFKPAKSGIQSAKVYNRYNYTIQELRINNDDKTFERGNFTASKPDKKFTNRQEYEDLVDTLKSMGYNEIDSDYQSLRNKTRKGI